MHFWVIFLFSIIPCGLLGLLLVVTGLIKSIRAKHRINIIIGCIGTFASIVVIIGGITGMMLLYVVLG